MPDAPFVSGTEILSNPGNAALGYSGTNVNYNFNPADTHPFASLETTIDALQANENKARLEKHLEQRADQEALAQTLAGMKGNGSAFNMKGPDGQNISFQPLPQDQAILNEKADNLRRDILKNPKGYKYDANFYKNKDEYDQLLVHAQQRAIEHTRNKLAAAQTMDPEDREGYLKHNQSEILDHPLTDMYQPGTYMPKQRIDPEVIFPSKTLFDKDNYSTMKATVVNRDGVGVEQDMVGLNGNVLDIRKTLVPGTKAYIEAYKMSVPFVKEAQVNPDRIRQMNANLAAINEQRGYKPGNIHYQPPVAEIDPQTGQVSKISTDPVQIAGALYFEKYGALQPKEKISDFLEKQKKAKSDSAHQGFEEKLELRKQDEVERNNRANNAKKGGTSTQELKDEANRNAAQAAKEETDKIFEQEVPDVPRAYPAYWKSKIGVDPNKYNIAEIHDKRAERLIGVEAAEIKGIVPHGTSKIPTKTYLIQNKDTKEKELIFMEGPENGEKKVVARVPQKDASLNLLKHNAKYNPKIYEDQAVWLNHKGEQAAPESTASSSSKSDGDSEEVIRARLVPARVKKSDGTIVDILYDPVTKKRYAK